MPLVRFLPPDDERVRATVIAIREELTENGLVLRYRTDETDDGLSGEEGTFLICSFWLVSRRCRRSASTARPSTCASGCSPTPRRWASTREELEASSGATSATTRRRSPTWR